MSIKNQIYHQQDFSHQDLQQHVYEGCQFINCCFDRSDLRDAKFINCKFIEAQALEGCSFQYANLKDASFENCMLAMNQFVGAECFGIEFRQCDLKGANFQRANFVNRISHSAYFCSAYITGCNLTYANFERTLLEKCELFENRWKGANLFGASMQGQICRAVSSVRSSGAHST